MYQDVLAADPGNPEANFRLGLIAHRRGRFDDAVRFLRAAIVGIPGQPVFHYTLGLAYHDLGRLDEAGASFRTAISLHPQFVEAYNNLGIVLQDQRRLEDAALELNKALRIRPQYPSALNNLGSVLTELGRVEEAQRCLRQALSLQPDYQRAHYNLGKVLAIQNRHAEAVAALSEAIRLDPGHYDTLVSLGDALAQTNRAGEARSCYDRALKLDPGRPRAMLGAALTLPMVYQSVEEIDAARERYEAGLLQLRKGPDAFHGLAPRAIVQDLQWTNFFLAYQGRDDLALQSRYGDFITEALGIAVPELMAPIEPRAVSGRRIRVGYVSRFFRYCTAGLYFKGWITQADRNRFEVCIYNLNHLEDDVTRQIRDASDAYCKLTGDIEAVARKIRHDALDILVFPEVGMADKNFVLAAMRLAPVQCAGWGHPVTTGLPNIDYFISCSKMEPPEADRYYTEKLCLLDGIGTCYDTPVLPEPKTRTELGLPSDRTLYLFPQSLFKIHPDNDAILSRILAAQPAAALVMFRDPQDELTDSFLARLNKTLASQGIDATRQLIVLPYMSHDEYLRVNLACDLMLDSLHWSGGQTALDALACGLPIVTLPGAYMRGRQTAAMLQLAGVPELIAADAEDYISLAIRAGRDRLWRDDLRERIRMGVKKEVFDQTAPVRSLERFYKKTILGEQL